MLAAIRDVAIVLKRPEGVPQCCSGVFLSFLSICEKQHWNQVIIWAGSYRTVAAVY